MNALHIVNLTYIMAIAVILGVRHADAAPPSKKSIGPSLLAKMGVAGMKPVSDQYGEKIRGKGFFLSNGQQILAAQQFDFRNLTVAFQKNIHFRKSLDFAFDLKDYRQVLGPAFAEIDLSNVSLRVSRVVEFNETVNFYWNQTSFQGTNVVFGAPLRVVGGVFP